MMNIVVMISLLALSVSADLSQENQDQITRTSQSSSEICSFITDFLSEGQELPSFIPYSNEVFNLYTGSERELIASITISDKKVKSFDCVGSQEHSYEVFVYDKSTIENIINADSQVKALNEALKEGTIEVKATTIGGRIKTSAMRMITRVAAWFG